LAELGQALDWVKTTDRTTVITIVSDAFTWTPGDKLWDVGVPQVSEREKVKEAAKYQADVRKKQRIIDGHWRSLANRSLAEGRP